ESQTPAPITRTRDAGRAGVTLTELRSNVIAMWFYAPPTDRNTNSKSPSSKRNSKHQTPNKSIPDARVGGWTLELSFTSQRHHRLDFRGASSGQPAGNQRNHHEHNRDSRNGLGVARWQFRHRRRQRPRRGECAADSEQRAHQNQTQSAAKDQPQHVAFLCAQGHANADLPRPLGDETG